MKIPMLKQTGRLIPLDEEGEDVLRDIPHGDEVMVEIRRPRNIRQHRLFFALLTLVVRNTEAFDSVEDLRDYIARKAGWGHYSHDPDGVRTWHSASMSFASMPQDDFNTRIWNTALDVIVAEILPMERETLEREVFDMIGIDYGEVR